MSCVHFPNGITVSQADLMRETFGPESVFDGFTALYDGGLDVSGDRVSALANQVGQPVEVSVHGDGEIVEMRDGTKYRVTRKGWQKVPA